MEWKGEGWKVGTKGQSLLEAIHRVSGSLSGRGGSLSGVEGGGVEGWTQALSLPDY